MTRNRSEAGVTLLEVLVVVVVIGLSVGAVAMNLAPLEAPLQSGTTLLEGFLRQARLNAIATTSAYRVSPNTAYKLQAETANSCGASSWTGDNSMNLNMPSGVEFDSTSWTVCFSSRGISADNIKIALSHDDYGTIGVEVLLGGTTRVIR